MQFLNPEDRHKEFTYEDLFILPQYSEVYSRMDVDLTASKQIPLSIPVIVANMNAVAGKRMAETVTRRGGMVVLPQDKSFEEIKEMIAYIKHCHPVFETPIVLEEDSSLQKALNLIHKRSHKAVLVVDDHKRPVGIFTEADARQKDLYTPLSKVMTRQVIHMQQHASVSQIYEELHVRRLPIMPIVDDQGKLVGVLTKKGAIRTDFYKPTLNESNEFYTAVAVGINKDLENEVSRLLEIGVDLIVLDTAHGHQKKMLDAISLVRNMIGKEKPLCAGNIVTEKAAYHFIEAGASILKVGVGPGAVCTTRMMTGVGRPQFSAVKAVSDIARESQVEVWADGGCKHPRDVALALASGAHSVMIGTWFAGTYESPADILRDQDGHMYKENFGMASHRAVSDRTSQLNPFDQGKKEFFVEGVSQSKMYLKQGEESVEDILDIICAGVRSACAYTGAKNLEEFFQKVLIGSQSSAGYKEGQAVEKRW